MLLCFVVKKTSHLIQEHHATTDSLRISANDSLKHPSPQSRQLEPKMTIGHYHFCAKNEYIDGRFLAGVCGSRQRQVADGADVVFTNTPYITSRNSPQGLFLAWRLYIG